MFKQILLMQWKVSRFVVLLLLPLCVGLPIVLLRIAQRFATGAYEPQALIMLRIVDRTSVSFPVLAGAVGCAIALTAWAWDHRTNHVYALSLPVERWRYALMKMGAGALMLLLLSAGLLVGSLIALAFTQVPEGLRGYPVSFTVRFLFAALICYAVTFAFAAGTIRTTARIFGALFVIFVVGSLAAGMLSDALQVHIPEPMELLGNALVTWPGPFSVFGGNWMLIDV